MRMVVVVMQPGHISTQAMSVQGSVREIVIMEVRTAA